MKKDTAQVIFRTVVVAGAMLGAGACAGKKTQNTTINNTTVTAPSGSGDPTAGSATDPANGSGADSADPCSGDARARGGGDEGGGEGRGFVLS